MIAKLKTIDRRLLTVLLIVFVQMLGAAMIMPILPLYAQREFGMSPQTITLLATSFFAAQFIAGPYLGRLSDKYGRLPILIISQVGTAVSFLMLALAPSVAFLYVARILDGITGGNIIVAQAYVTDITPRAKRTESLGYIFAVFGLGFIFGPAIGGLLSAAFGPRIPYIFAAVAATIVVLLTWFTLDETLSPEQREANRRFNKQNIGLSAIAANKPLVLILLIAFVGQFGLGLLQSTFALFGEAVLFAGYSETVISLGIGILLALVGVGQFFTQAFLLPRALKQFDEAWLVIIGLVLRTVGLFIFAALASPWLGGAASLLFAMGVGLMMPPLQSLTTTTVADELRGGVLGIYQSTISLSTIVSTAIAGTIFAWNATSPYWVGAILSLVVALPALVLVRRTGAGRRKPAAVSASTD
ncbi:MAG: MFS transporter [Ardenticatenaceae bacterium]|nr:MFS transporter [Ardenticatenaceae bacterium]MCB8988459.1 MFS transporter [Ardenticatenaceae bacterium]